MSDFDSYLDYALDRQYPPAPKEPVVDTSKDFGSITPIKQTQFESVLEKTGLTLEQVGNELDKLGKVNIGGIELGIRDFLPFVGSMEDGKVTGTPATLQALGRGESIKGKSVPASTVGPDGRTYYGISGQPPMLNTDAAMTALDVATAGVIKPAAKAGKAAVKKVIDAGKNLPVGMSIKAVDGAEAVLEKAPAITTKPFKNWFGDSKVTDEAGKPMVVYHGTANDFDEFKTGFKGASENETSKIGFWFTDNPDTAASFAERQSSEFVTKTDPATGDIMKWEDGTPKKFRADNEVGQVMPVYLSIKKPLVFESKDGKDAFEAFMDFRDKWAEYVNGTKGVEGAWRNRYVALNVEKTNKEFLNYLKENGYDGIILKNTEYDAPSGKTINQYMLTDPTAIKSAIGNKGTFDPKNPSMLKGAGAATAGATATQEESK
jgi:hypothetical protein